MLSGTENAETGICDWGNLSVNEGCKLSETNNAVHMTTISMHSYISAECRNNPYMDSYWFTENMICAGRDNISICLGESGGPLIAEIDDKFTLVGVTSWSIGMG